MDGIMNKQEYIDYHGIKSIIIIQEVMTKEPMLPQLIIKRLDGTEEKIWGTEKISKKLNKIFENV